MQIHQITKNLLFKSPIFSSKFAFSSITLTTQDRIAYLTLSNPKKRNPLRQEVIEELGTHLSNLEKEFQDRE